LSQAVENKRRTPSKARSAATVETILEAVAQILESGSANQFTTNRVAERAGYSIGTLYNYFPNKQSLLRALVQRETHKQESALRRLLESQPEVPTEALIRRILRSALRPFDERRGLQRVMMGLLFSERDIVDSAMAVGERLMPLLNGRLGAARSASVRDGNSITVDVTLGSVIGAIMTVGRRDPSALQSPEVEDELVRLLTHGLRLSSGSSHPVTDDADKPELCASRLRDRPRGRTPKRS
jgi:AcrR family transcriptional regulator